VAHTAAQAHHVACWCLGRLMFIRSHSAPRRCAGHAAAQLPRRPAWCAARCCTASPMPVTHTDATPAPVPQVRQQRLWAGHRRHPRGGAEWRSAVHLHCLLLARKTLRARPRAAAVAPWVRAGGDMRVQHQGTAFVRGAWRVRTQFITIGAHGRILHRARSGRRAPCAVTGMHGALTGASTGAIVSVAMRRYM